IPLTYAIFKKANLKMRDNLARMWRSKDMEEDGLMTPEEFNRFFALVLKDKDFRDELKRDGFGTLERFGFCVKVPPEIRASLARIVDGPGLTAANRCGTCGVCGLCSLCGSINAGSGSAFLWATFFLGGSFTSQTSARPGYDC
ncbi:MAG: hypothetical protein NUK54_00865, partial [Methanothrix sp.]|nr:hypothetical protein [Methanothrix sp.]